MKVLHFITSLKIGGAESALCNLLEHWNEQNSDIEHCVIYIHGGPCVDRIRSLGIKLFQIKGVVSPYDPVAFWRLFKLVKKIGPDLIHSALWSANFMAAIIAKKQKISLISDLHGDCRYHGKIRNFLHRFTLNVPAQFVSVSHSVNNSFTKMFSNISNKTVVIQNGIDTKKFYKKAMAESVSRNEFGLGPDDFIVGTVGRLCKIKRYDLLIEAFAKFSRKSCHNRVSHLCIVGDGPERENLELLAKKLGIGKFVHFAGEQEKVYRYYPLFDCFVLASQSEGLSIALLEALAIGLPIITTSEDEKHDVITNGVNGFLIPVNKKSKLVQVLTDLCTNKNNCSSMSKFNIGFINEKFQISHVAKKYFDLYKKV
jgi:glycosyltransferase involved in cell wall biosynthesis